MDFSEKLGASIVGLGIGEQHARAFHSSSHSYLEWLYDLESTLHQTLIEELGEGFVASDYEMILNSSATKIISIASYDDVHYAQTLAAIEAGKHVFVEKPLCRSQEELRALKQAWQRQGNLKLVSNLVLRAAPVYRWLKSVIESGDLGEIYAFDGDYLYGRLNKITNGWRKNVKDYSVMQGGGIHLVDLMLWLTGQNPISVTATGNRICSTGTNFQYNDYVAATFLFASGLVGRITANFGCVHRHQHVVRVFGTKATFIYDDCGARIHMSRVPSIVPDQIDLSALPSSKGALIPDFVDSIVRQKDTMEITNHEFNLMSVCFAADQALRVANPVEIKYV